jgi:hypothetical protein
MRSMAQRKPFLLRLDPATHEALQRWADSDLRSLNAQIEFLLRLALRESGRLRAANVSTNGPGRGTKVPGTEPGEVGGHEPPEHAE